MAVTIVHVLLTIVWTDYVLTVSADQEIKAPDPTIVYSTPVNHRSPKDIREKSNTQGLELSPELKTTGQKWSSEEYHTLSSLTSPKDAVVGDSQDTTKINVYPTLTTISPPYITRSRYIRNPYLYNVKGYHQEMEVVNDQLSDYSADNGNAAMPKWNRHYPGQRQLKKYSPVMMETDVSMDSNNVIGGGSGYNGYDNGVDYSTNSNYEVENFKNPNGGDDNVVGWYGEPSTHSSRPAAPVEISRPGHKMTFDVHKLSMLALIKIGLAKLKVLTVLKFLAFLSLKIKLLTFLKMVAFAKFAVMGKLVKLFVLPFLPNLLTWLRNATLMQLNPAMPMNTQSMMTADTGGSTSVQLRNDSVAESVHKRSDDTSDALGGNVASNGRPNLLQFAASVLSARCVEKMACRVAGVRPPSLQSVWINWILSSLVDFIPIKKLKLYISTIKDVTDYRLENIFVKSTTEDWLKWCDERYSCEEEITNNILI